MPSLHACIGLGQMEEGFLLSDGPLQRNQQEIDRLPLLLRWLAMARPRAKIPEVRIVATEVVEVEPKEADEEDPLTDEVVRCLEDRAAMYSEAETVELMACNLAPTACKSFLKRNNRKQKKNPKKSNSKQVVEEEDEDDYNDDETVSEASSVEEEPDIMQESTRDGEPIVEDDARALLRVIHELAKEKTISDGSLLFQPEGKPALASLMHNLPTLKHKDVAEIVCRSGAPKRLLSVMGANCPSAVQSILVGSNRHPEIASLCPHRCRSDFGDLLIEQDPLAAACQIIRGLRSGSSWADTTASAVESSLQVKIVESFVQQISASRLPGRSTIFLKAYCMAVMFWNPKTTCDLSSIQSDVSRKSKMWDVALIVAAASLNQPKLCDLETIKDEELKSVLKCADADALEYILKHRTTYDQSLSETFRVTLLQLVESFRTPSEPMVVDDGPEVPPHLVQTALLLSGQHGDTMTATLAEVVLKKLLFCNADEASHFACLPGVGSFIRSAVSKHKTSIPLVSTVRLQQLLPKVRFDDPRLLLQTFYCFILAAENPTSPFKFDPRALPLCHIKSASRTSAFGAELAKLVDLSCPEVKLVEQLCANFECVDPPVVRKAKTELSKIILRSATHPDSDPDGQEVEVAFKGLASHLSLPDLVTTCVSSLQCRDAPRSFTTYSILYRDPLGLLKFPLSVVWRRGGTRRLFLLLLEILLETNAVVAHEESKDANSVDEFMACRNALVLQTCLSVLTSDQLPASSRQCEVAVSFVRRMVARHQGLAVALLRLGLPDAQQDWLTEWVPEVLGDASVLRSLLLDSAALTSAQRLCVADYALRIVISFGFMQTSETETLVSVALSQLLTSFFVILGPVGMSVEVVLGGDAKRVHSTKVARKAVFRMLRAIERIRGYRVRLRSECLVTLQKLSTYCRGDGSVGGALPSGLTSRQKAFLKELMEAVSKSLESLSIGS